MKGADPTALVNLANQPCAYERYHQQQHPPEKQGLAVNLTTLENSSHLVNPKQMATLPTHLFRDVAFAKETIHFLWLSLAMRARATCLCVSGQERGATRAKLVYSSFA